jgi:hypothetical protein
MIKKLIVAIILIAVLCATAGARMPQVGDKVMIAVNAGSFHAKYTGIITDFENGFICMKCSEATAAGMIYVSTKDKPIDACVGVGAIIALKWL